ncbi:MAG: MFS transporter [Porticoccaceae bacterium]
MKSILQLLTSERFLPIFLAQFGGALNDNLFKSAMLIIVAFQLTDAAAEASTINNLAALLFILPYFLFSVLAGQLSDRSDKSVMIQNNKIAEICIVLLGALALYMQSIPLLLFILFCLGAQSAMFGPNKYAVLPQLLQGKELVGGNALIASGTFTAILLGTLIGGILAQQQSAWIWIASGCLVTAIGGYLASRRIPKTDIGSPDLKIDWNLPGQTLKLISMARGHFRVWTAILGVSWFWFVGSAYLTQIPTIVRYIGGGDESVVTLFLALFIIGVGLGCTLAAKLSGYLAEVGLAPLALLLLALSGLDLAQIDTHTPESLLSVSGFLGSPDGLRISLDILLIGIFGGAFALPMYTELQQASYVENRARIISINNVINAIFMVISAIIAIVMLGILQYHLSSYLTLIAFLNLLFSLFMFWRTPVQSLRFLAEVSSRLIYRVESSEIANLPEKGPALLICNHVSYADPIIIFGACKRPIRFIMAKDIRNKPMLKLVFEASRTLAICSPVEDRKTYEETIREAAESLKNGELVMIFPEGRLSPDGEIGQFRRGVEKLLEIAPVPVYPMAIRGIWGSFFSHGSGPAIKSGFHIRLRRRAIQLRVGAPLSPEGLNALIMQRKVEQLRGEFR